MIIAIIGEQGSGKTMLMSVLLLLHKLDGHKIITNYDFRYKDEYIEGTDFELYEELFKQLENSIKTVQLGVDEAHVSFDSRTSRKNTKRTRILTQMRKALKEKGNFYYATQFLNQVDVRLRMNTAYLMLCEKIIKKKMELIKVTIFKSKFNNLVSTGKVFYVNLEGMKKLALYEQFEMISA